MYETSLAKAGKTPGLVTEKTCARLREYIMNIENLIQISETEWEIPTYLRHDMRVPVRLFATRELLEQIINDKSLEQAQRPGGYGLHPSTRRGNGRPNLLILDLAKVISRNSYLKVPTFARLFLGENL